MILTDFLPARLDRQWQLACQLGGRHAIREWAPGLTGMSPPSDMDSRRTTQSQLAGSGTTLRRLEGDGLDRSRIKFGRGGRVDDIERYCQILLDTLDAWELRKRAFPSKVIGMSTITADALRNLFSASGYSRKGSNRPAQVGAGLSDNRANRNRLRFVPHPLLDVSVSHPTLVKSITKP